MSAGDEQSIDRSRILISNPVSGSGDHAETISRRAAEHGFTVRHTAHEGDAMRLAREAADSSSEALIAAAGGDGTVNEVVNGIVAADASSRRRSPSFRAGLGTISRRTSVSRGSNTRFR